MDGALDHGLQDFGALLPDQPAELSDNRSLGGIMAEQKAHNRYYDSKQCAIEKIV
jgi:hypothetical protein